MPQTYRKIIFGFVVVFLLSLTNSIFLNQLGYYGALVIMLVAFARAKDNPFGTTGLEIPFLLFIGVEFVSALFSEYQGNAFHNLLKRLLLIPLVYVFAYYPAERRDIVRIVKIYIFGAVVVCGIYVYNAVQHYFENLYRSSESGPSIFQYPITSAELYSFLVILLFALVRYGKITVSTRVLASVLLLVSGAALLATFKGTGWIGTAAGIITVLVYKKDKYLLIPLVVFSIAIFLIDKNISTLHEMRIKDGRISNHVLAGTEGRLYGVAGAGNSVLLADFDKGIKKLRPNLNTDEVLQTPSPVTGIYQADTAGLVLELMDTRYITAQYSSGKMETGKIFMSPGLTRGAAFNAEYGALLDKDSGLTIYPLWNKETEPIYKNKELKHAERIEFFAGSLFMASPENGLTALQFINGIPGDIIIVDSTREDVSLMKRAGDMLLISGKKSTEAYTWVDSSGELLKYKSFAGCVNAVFASHDKGEMVFVTRDNHLFQFDNDDSSQVNGIQLDFTPSSVLYKNGNIYLGEVKRSKVLRLFDPHHYSNFSRIQMWITGWRIFKEYPFFGVGDISLEPYYIKYKNPYLKEIQGHLHNNYMHVLAILGGVGFVIFMGLLAAVWFRLHKVYKNVKEDSLYHVLSTGIIGVFVSFLASGLTEWNFGDHEIITMVWFLTGLAIAMQKLHPPRKVKPL